MSIERQNPFPGLRPFTPEEDYLFFGREQQTLELLERLSQHRFVSVVGTSGSGKSSLVRCGLLSELLGGKMLQAGANWEIAVTQPGGNPLGLLTAALLQADLYDPEEEHVHENLLATLSRSHFGLIEAVRQAGLGEGTNFLLVVDQFEEIFRFHEAGQKQQEMANEFISLLLEAATQTEVPIYIVLTMRSDFIGECGQFEGLAEAVNRGEFLIPRLTREQFKRVIEGPIKVAGGRITPRLLQRLLNDVGQQADQLPCLQHALMRSWDVWSQRSQDQDDGIDLHDYQRIGKMDEALSLHADEVFDSLADSHQRELCRGVFQALTLQESENRGIRRPQRMGQLCQILDVPLEDLIPIVNAYRASGVTFLMPPAEVELTERTVIDISHESLMRVWSRLRYWVEEEAQAAGIYRRLSESAALHAEGKAGLFRNPELGITLAWREANHPNRSWAERYYPGFERAIEFLRASEQASLAEVAAREEARKREVAQAKQLADVQRRAATRLRWLVSGLAVVALLAVVATINAVAARSDAEAARQLAVDNETRATQNAAQAEDAAERASREAERAVHNESAARNSEQQAKEALYIADIARTHHTLLEGNTRQSKEILLDYIPFHEDDPDPRGFEWFYLWNDVSESAQNHRIPKVFLPIAGDWDISLETLGVSADGRRGVAGIRGMLIEFDTTDFQVVGLPMLLGSAELNDQVLMGLIELKPDVVCISTRRDIIAALEPTKGIQCWSIKTHQRLGHYDAPTTLRNLRFLADGDLLVSCGRDGKIYLWDTTTTPWLRSSFGVADGGVISSFEVLPSSNQIVVATSEYSGRDSSQTTKLTVWDLDQQMALDSIEIDQTSISQMCASRNGQIACASDDGTIQIRNGILEPVASFEKLGPVESMTFSADSKRFVAATSRDNTVKVWSTETWNAPPAELKVFGSEATTVGFGKDVDSLIASCKDGRIRSWDLSRTTVGAILDEELHAMLRECEYVAINGRLQTAFCWSRGGPLQRFDLQSRKRLPDWNDGQRFESVSVPENGVAIATLSLDRRMQVWDSSSEEVLYQTQLKGNDSLEGFVLSQDGSKVVWAVAEVIDGMMGMRKSVVATVHDGRTGDEQSFEYRTFGQVVHALSAKADQLFTLQQNLVREYDVRNLKEFDSEKRTYVAGFNLPHRIVAAPDGQIFASLAKDVVGGSFVNQQGNTVHLHDRNGEVLKTMDGHAGRVNCATFSPDHRRLATGGKDRTVRIWDTETGNQLLVLRGNDGPVDAVSFSQDGNTLFSVSKADGKIFVWRATSPSSLENNFQYWEGLAKRCENTGGSFRAYEAYSRAIKLAPNAIETRKALVRLGQSLGRFDEMVEHYSHIVASGEHPHSPTIDRLALKPIVSDGQPVTWKYTFQQPTDDWKTLGFDASLWDTGQTPMGNERLRTPWNTPDIWMRYEFELDEPIALPLELYSFINESAQIYLNGVQIGSGYHSDEEGVTWPCVKAEAIQRGANVLAVHCFNRVGRSHIDVSLNLRQGFSGWIAQLSRLLDSDERNVFLLYARMQAYLKMGKAQNASKDAEMLVSLLQDEVTSEIERNVVGPSRSAQMFTESLFASYQPSSPDDRRVSNRMSPSDTWRLMAAAYYLLGDQTRLEHLLQSRPQVGFGIGVAQLECNEWSQASKTFDKLLEVDPNHVDALVGRAEANFKLQRSQLAKADIAKAIELETEPASEKREALQLAYRTATERYNRLEFWEAAKAFGWKHVDMDGKTDRIAWHRLAYAMLRTDDVEGYRRLCQRMVSELPIGPTFNHLPDADVENNFASLFQVTLVLPNAIELSRLPEAVLIDASEVSRGTREIYWSWMMQALLAYRKGEPELTLDSIDRALDKESIQTDIRAWSIAIRALAFSKLGRVEEAQRDLELVADLVRRLNEYPKADKYFDQLAPALLMHEAEQNLRDIGK